MKEFAKIIKEARKESGYSQDALATLAGLSRPQIANIESGLHLPSLKKFSVLCCILDLDTNVLCEVIAAEDLKTRKASVLRLAKVLDGLTP